MRNESLVYATNAAQIPRVGQTVPEARSAAHGSEWSWLTGIEDTFITAPFEKTGRTLDEYELTQHYQNWRTDLELMTELGVRKVRYGVPWHRINPAPGEWDFSWADPQLERLLELGIEPVVDLVHYGVPAWMQNAFLAPDYDQHVAEFAARLAERYRGRIRRYTPLNEPRITAWYSGRLGWWPPFRRGPRGFVLVLTAVCKGVIRTVNALRSVDPEITCLHVDATDLYETQESALEPEVTKRQELVFLALDLISGRVDEAHPLRPWLLEVGATKQDLEWFLENAIELDVIGLNIHPLQSQKVLSRNGGRLRLRTPYASPVIVERLAELYHARYGRPVLVSETASEGSLKRRRAWLRDSVAAVARARQRGIPIVGYTWWPMFALVTWAYRHGTKAASAYIRQMGLWDLRLGPRGELIRVRTPLVDAYRELVTGGAPVAIAAVDQPA